MMDFIWHADVLSKALATFIAVATTIGVFYRWVKPRLGAIAADIRAGRDALVGREEIVDNLTGKTLAPALPGMGVRMDVTEIQLREQSSALTSLANAVSRMADSTLRLDDHDRRIQNLEDAHVERVVTRAESTAAWQAVEAVAKATPPRDAEPLTELGEN